MRTRAQGGRAGFTLIEIMISTTVLLVLAGSLVTVLRSMKMVASSSSTETRLQQSGERALLQILDDVGRSGFVTLPVPGEVEVQPYPFLFDGGDASNGWSGAGGFAPPPTSMAAHNHAPPVQTAEPGEPAAGASREIVFVVPADLDGNGIPDVDAEGDLVWDVNQVSYVVVTDANGTNVLERRIDGGVPQRIASNVERITFDNNAIANAIPLRSLRVQVFLRHVDAEGAVQRYVARTTLRLRNTPQPP